ncbi:MAG: hypothetical protein LBT36_06615, partial [Oscillospiraceae bacterium]|nr:hypothetical protein [Oscillospiraceae bacterium]
SYLVFQSTFSYRVERKSSLLWLYKTVQRNRYNGIPTGKTFYATMHFASGRQERTAAKESQVDAMLQELAAQSPNALIGFNQNLANLWLKKDKTAFYEARDAAKRDSLRPPEASPNPNAAPPPIPGSDSDV